MATDDPFAEATALDEPAALAPDAPGPGLPQTQQPQQPRTQKPRSNVYTMMLILSLAAIVTSCVVLYLHLDKYGTYPWWKIPAEVTSEVGT